MLKNSVTPKPLEDLLPGDLLALCQRRSFDVNEMVFHMDSPPKWMFYVIQGEVILERVSAGGEASCLQRCHTGFLAEASLTSTRYHCNARSTRTTELVQMPLQSIRDRLKSDLMFANRWIQMLGAELRALRLQNERLSLLRVEERIMHLVQTEGKDGRYTLHTSLKQVAQSLGVTHEALYRGLSSLVAKGLLMRDSDAIQLRHR